MLAESILVIAIFVTPHASKVLLKYGSTNKLVMLVASTNCSNRSVPVEDGKIVGSIIVFEAPMQVITNYVKY